MTIIAIVVRGRFSVLGKVGKPAGESGKLGLHWRLLRLAKNRV